MEENRKEFERLKNDPDYTEVKFDDKTGGLQATHKDHNFDPAIGIFGIPRGEYEKLVVEILYDYGYKAILESEKAGYKIKTPEGFLNDKIFDIKAIESDGKYTVRNKFLSANKQKVETVVLYYHETSVFSIQKLKEGYGQYINMAKADNIKTIYYIIENKLYRFK
jgi:hypothetical protein